VKKKLVTLTLLALLIPLMVYVGTEAVRADDYNDKFIAFGSGVTLYSPLNRTYTSDSPLLNLTFSQGIGFRCQLSYSLDGESPREIPMTPESSSVYRTIIPVDVPPISLPPLNDGSHCISITVDATADGYNKTWVHTIYFAIDTNKPVAPTGGLVFSSGLRLLSPLTQTYNTNPVTFNITFNMGVQTHINYSLDGVYSGDIPLKYLTGTEIIFINVYSGSVTLPMLSNGSHCLTITVESDLNDYHGANPPGAPFKATNAEGTNWAAVWVHTIYFAVDSGVSTAAPSPTATSTANPEAQINTVNATPTTQSSLNETQHSGWVTEIIILAAALAYIAVITVLVLKKR
jgi:hypothetical protein